MHIGALARLDFRLRASSIGHHIYKDSDVVYFIYDQTGAMFLERQKRPGVARRARKAILEHIASAVKGWCSRIVIKIDIHSLLSRSHQPTQKAQLVRAKSQHIRPTFLLPQVRTSPRTSLKLYCDFHFSLHFELDSTLNSSASHLLPSVASTLGLL